MGKKQIQKALDTFTARVKRAYKPDRVILFGSFARGKPNDESDVDLLIVASSFRRVPKEKRFDDLYRLTQDLRPDFHVFGLTPQEYQTLSSLVSISEAKQHGIDLL